MAKSQRPSDLSRNEVHDEGPSARLSGDHASTHRRQGVLPAHRRPIATITSDSLKDYGIDEFGGRIHDLLGTRCDPCVNRMLTGEDFDFHCHSNLVRAVAPCGLTEFDVHDVLNVFRCAGLNRVDRYFMRASPANQGDRIEFFAEIDLLCALSTCPGGDLSVPLWGPDSRDPIDVCRPLGVEVPALDPALLVDWKRPESPAYKGAHGMRLAKPE